MTAGDQSKTRIVQAELDVKRWRAQLPTVDEVRPGRCPVCEAPSCPADGALRLHGHGLRQRHQWGPADVGAAAAVIGLLARRYRCQPCRAVIMVVPLGLLPGRLYSAGAIALALALWGVAELAPAEVRRGVSPHPNRRHDRGGGLGEPAPVVESGARRTALPSGPGAAGGG